MAKIQKNLLSVVRENIIEKTDYSMNQFLLKIVKKSKCNCT